MDFCNQSASIVTTDRVPGDGRFDMEKVDMHTAQYLFVAGMLAIIASAAIGPTAQFATDYECRKSDICEGDK